jgi:hypothetical protein
VLREGGAGNWPGCMGFAAQTSGKVGVRDSGLSKFHCLPRGVVYSCADDRTHLRV